MEAYVLIKTNGGKARTVLDAVRKMGGVDFADGTYGSYDMVLRVNGDDLVSLVVDRIRKLEGVTDTNTLIKAI